MIKGSDDLVGAIARNLSESVETPASMKGEHRCEICGATYTVDTEEYGAATCPVCGTLPADKTADANVDEQDVVNGLEELAKEYADAVKNEDFDKANEIAKECEEQDAKIVTESLASGGTAIVLEKYIKKVDSNGNITKVKVKTKKKRLTSGQKQALRKARKLAHKGQANRKRKKAMKIRKRKGLSESLIARNLKIMTESLGRTPSASEISNMTARVKFVTEALEFDETEKIVDVLTAAFFERNIDVIDSVTGTRGKAITVERRTCKYLRSNRGSH